MGWNLSEEEAKALWEVEDVPHGPKAHEWESPDERCIRYEKALRGILACSSNDRMVIMLQAVAAAALREHELEKWYMERLK
jgi:hypothetical protein